MRAVPRVWRRIKAFSLRLYGIYILLLFIKDILGLRALSKRGRPQSLLFRCFARRLHISEYKSITQTLQKQSNNAINDYFDELERCAYEISNDYLVNDFVSTPDPSGSKYYNLQPIQQSLSVYALQSGGEVSRYLYMDNIGRALSSDAIFRLHEFYASLGLEAAMSAGDFTTLLQDYHYNELYVFETGGKSEALMLTSVPLVGGTPKGTLVQVMNPETIAGMIQSNSAVEDSTTVLLIAERNR